jgi:hypothetical protein
MFALRRLVSLPLRQPSMIMSRNIRKSPIPNSLKSIKSLNSLKSIKDMPMIDNLNLNHNHKVYEKLKVIGNNYKKFLSVAVPVGSTLGTAFVIGHMFDVKSEEKRQLSNKEMIGYPIVGVILGGFIGATSPVWICFSPVYFIAGGEITASLIKIILAGILLSDDNDNNKKD